MWVDSGPYCGYVLNCCKIIHLSLVVYINLSEQQPLENLLEFGETANALRLMFEERRGESLDQEFVLFRCFRQIAAAAGIRNRGYI